MRRRLPTKSFLGSFLAVLFVFGIFFSFITYRSLVGPADSGNASEKTVEIEKGESTVAIATRLKEAGLIRSVFGFRLTVKQEGLAGKLQAGTYQLSPSMSASEIAARLTKGFDTQLKLTIPEGFRTEEIAAKVEDVLGIPKADFLEIAKGKEGYLFPDTYLFSANTTSQQVVDRLTGVFASKTKSLKPTEPDVILASLVERETKGDAEKPIVAGILKKRLDAGWPLQLDATVQYLAGREGEWWPETTLLDRQRPSPYNTYLHQGLPPGPIANSGLPSIRAVLNPQDSPYWYYLHDSDGQIHYAETIEDHEANIATYIR